MGETDKLRLDWLETYRAKIQPPHMGDSAPSHDWWGVFWFGKDAGAHGLREAIDAAIVAQEVAECYNK